MTPITRLPRGITPVLQAPFDASGGIGDPSLARLIGDAIEAGAAARASAGRRQFV